MDDRSFLADAHYMCSLNLAEAWSKSGPTDHEWCPHCPEMSLHGSIAGYISSQDFPDWKLEEENLDDFYHYWIAAAFLAGGPGTHT